MRAKTKKELINKYTIFYRIYRVLSILLIVTAVILTAVFYLSDLKDVITISHLFMLLFVFLLAFYCEMNALHYHRLIIEIQLSIRKQKAPNLKKGSPARKKL